MVLSEVMVSLDPHTGHLGTDLLFDSPHVSRRMSTLDLILHRVNGFDRGLLQVLSHQPHLTCVGIVSFLPPPLTSSQQRGRPALLCPRACQCRVSHCARGMMRLGTSRSGYASTNSYPRGICDVSLEDQSPLT